MTIELANDGWGILDEGIQEIENAAREGAFSDRDTVSRFHQIADRARSLRQTLKEVSVICPENKQDGPEAA